MSQILTLISIRDLKRNSFSAPQPFVTLGDFERRWSHTINKNDQSMEYSYPEDFTAHKIGTFDDLTGEIKLEQSPVQIFNALQLKEVAKA